MNGEKSENASVGWGGIKHIFASITDICNKPNIVFTGPGGRVYQKAYVEFFTSPEKLSLILLNLYKFPSLSLYAVDHSGVSHFGGLTNTL